VSTAHAALGYPDGAVIMNCELETARRGRKLQYSTVKHYPFNSLEGLRKSGNILPPAS
jgi:hypothetical protein